MPCRTIACAYASRTASPDGSPVDSAAIAHGPGERHTVTLGAHAIAIEPQNPGSPRDSRSGRWREERGDSTILVESLGEQMIAAILDAQEWSLTVASGRDAAFEGEWLRFSGGQALGGAYRAPSAPRALGRATLSWLDRDCLVVRTPDGTSRTYRAAATAPAQNVRSTEKCAS